MASVNGGAREVAGDAEVVAEVAGADEQHVHPVEPGDLLRVADRGRRLDLDHAENLGVGAVQGARVQAEPAGPVVGGHAPVPGWRVAQVPDRLGDLVRGVEAGQHDARGPAVQDPSHPDAGRGFDPDHGGHAVAPGGRHDVADLLLAAGPVLEVEQHPVHPGRGADLGGHR